MLFRRLSAHALVVILSVSAVLAGCIADTDDTDVEAPEPPRVDADWWIGSVPSSLLDESHNHSSHAEHANLTTANFEVLGHDPLVTDRHGKTLTGMGCGGAVTRDDGRRLAVVHSISTVTSFVVADVTDPASPSMVGEFYLPNAVVWDATISADGQHVLIGAYPPVVFGRDPTLPPPLGQSSDILLLDAGAGADAEGRGSIVAYDHHGRPIDAAALSAPAWAEGMQFEQMIVYRDACSGQVVETGPKNHLPGPAIVMAGIQDPSDPVFEDYHPQPVIGPHSVGSQAIDGTVYATSSVTNLAHEASYYSLYAIEETPAGARLVPQSVIQTPGIATATMSDPQGISDPTDPRDILAHTWLNGHTDVYLHKHPFTEQVLAYLANWDGMYVYDVTIPQAPVQIGVWQDGKSGSIHTTYPFPYVSDDRFYMIAAQEVGEPVDLPSGWVYVLDVTDPTAPAEVSRWTLPVKPKWDSGGLQFSPHYVAILNETLFVSNYHGGLWAVDISDLGDPRAIGLFVPSKPSPNPWSANGHEPRIGDVIVDPETYVLTTWDNAGGVYQLRFDETMEKVRAPHYTPDKFGLE